MRSIKQLKKNAIQPNRLSFAAPVRVMRGKQSLLTQSLLVFCSFLFITITSCAPSTDTTSTPPDNSTLLASLIKTSNPNISGLTVTVDNSDPASPKVALGNLTNGASEVFTANINIDQEKGITTDPTSFTITASGIISPDTITTPLMVTFEGEAAVSYTVTTEISGAAVSDWIVTENERLGEYITVSFGGQSGNLSVTDGTLAITGLTNSPGGDAGMITFENLPAGFTAEPSSITLPNPDGTETATITPDPNSFTITETANTDNSGTYTIADIELVELTQFTPGIHIQITESGSTDPISGLTITEEAGNVIRIVGLTNKADQTAGMPNTYTLTINEVSGYFTLPPGDSPLTRMIAEPTVDFSSGTASAITFELTNSGESTPTTYTLVVDFSAAAPSDWFTTANLSTYITAASFGGESGTLTLDGTNLLLSGGDDFTNVPSGEISLTMGMLPDGYELMTNALMDPDGDGLAAVTGGDAGMITITETANPTNKQDYPVMITLGAYRSPLTPANITATYGGITADLSDKTVDTNMITISGFTNKAGASESGMVTFPEPMGYTVTPTTLPIPDPTGENATNEELDAITVTKMSTGVAVSHTITVNFLAEIEISVTSADINSGNPMTVQAGATIPITTAACELLTTPTVTVAGVAGSKVAESTPFPVYYDRERDMPVMTSGTITGYRVTRRLTLEDGNNNVIGTGFTVTMMFPACTTFAVGTGDNEANAYQIDNAPRLDLLSHLVNTDNPNYGDKYYKITENINMGLPSLPLSEVGSAHISGDGTIGKGFLPIGRNSAMFKGKFDCDSNTISGLYINRPNSDNIGLVGTTSNSTTSNCYLTDVNVTGKASVGGLVGANFTNSTVSNSHTTGSISATGNNVGGLVGFNFSNSTISDSYSTATVSGTRYSVGGLVGNNDNMSTITNSYTTGTVSGEFHVGGLTGNNQTNSRIIDSHATGPVTGTNTNTGGLVGFNGTNSMINNSYATGRVTGKSTNVGGLVGGNSSAMISNSYATGAVSGTSFSVGGLVGVNTSSTIADSYATGSVTGFNFVGGLVGLHDSASMISNSYARGNITGMGNTTTGLFIGVNGDITTAVSTGVTDSYYNTDATLTVRGSPVTAKGVGSDTTGASPITTANLTGLITANLQVAKGTMSGETYFTWDSAIWDFTAGQYPRLKTVVCANRQDDSAATDCTDMLQ